MVQKDKRYIPNIQYIKFNAQMLNESDYVPITSESYKMHNVNNEERVSRFMERLEAFRKVHTLKEAKELLDKTMPIKLDRTTFFIGNAKCIIINTDTQLRISFDSPEEFISFNFV